VGENESAPQWFGDWEGLTTRVAGSIDDVVCPVCDEVGCRDDHDHDDYDDDGP
jgi:hypothetical protein